MPGPEATNQPSAVIAGASRRGYAASSSEPAPGAPTGSPVRAGWHVGPLDHQVLARRARRGEVLQPVHLPNDRLSETGVPEARTSLRDLVHSCRHLGAPTDRGSWVRRLTRATGTVHGQARSRAPVDVPADRIGIRWACNFGGDGRLIVRAEPPGNRRLERRSTLACGAALAVLLRIRDRISRTLPTPCWAPRREARRPAPADELAPAASTAHGRAPGVFDGALARSPGIHLGQVPQIVPAAVGRAEHQQKQIPWLSSVQSSADLREPRRATCAHEPFRRSAQRSISRQRGPATAAPAMSRCLPAARLIPSSGTGRATVIDTTTATRRPLPRSRSQRRLGAPPRSPAHVLLAPKLVVVHAVRCRCRRIRCETSASPRITPAQPRAQHKGWARRLLRSRWMRNLAASRRAARQARAVTNLLKATGTQAPPPARLCGRPSVRATTCSRRAARPPRRLAWNLRHAARRPVGALRTDDFLLWPSAAALNCRRMWLRREPPPGERSEGR